LVGFLGIIFPLKSGEKSTIPSGYDIHSLPWLKSPFLIGKPAISMGHFPTTAIRIPLLGAQPHISSYESDA